MDFVEILAKAMLLCLCYLYSYFLKGKVMDREVRGREGGEEGKGIQFNRHIAYQVLVIVD